MTFIHVIIPVYNAKKYLREAVLSILNQPQKRIKIVLVDDGSNDGSGKLCDELVAQQNRITVIHQKNAGVSAARNTGIDYVLREGKEGDYITFLDADDLWHQNVINDSIISKIEDNNNVDVFLFGDISSNENCSAFSEPLCYTEKICFGGEEVIWPMQGHFSANLYSIRLFSNWNIRFIEGLKYSEDKIFKMQCLLLSEWVMYLPEILHIYRENSNSAMRNVFRIHHLNIIFQLLMDGLNRIISLIVRKRNHLNILMRDIHLHLFILGIW